MLSAWAHDYIIWLHGPGIPSSNIFKSMGRNVLTPALLYL